MRKLLYFAALLIFAATSCNNKKSNNGSQSEPLSLADSLELAMESTKDERSLYLFVGTYTANESEGIYIFQLDTTSGYSKSLGYVQVENPSYLTISKDEKFVYAVTENNDSTAKANAYSFDKESGKLKFINSQPTDGAAPCYIEIDDEGKHVLTANYTGASLTIFNIDKNGSLKAKPQVISFTGKSAHPTRQKQPHIHCARFTPDKKHVLVSDLGTDKIHKLDVNENTLGDFLISGTPTAFKVADGSGPRHIDYHPNGKWAYVITEISGDVIAFNYTDGNLKQIQSIKADTLDAQGSGDIHISPDGRFLYASNRLKGDGLAIFSINQTDGTLTKVGYQETGIHPRNFVFTPNGKFLLVAARDSNMIQIFEVDKNTGLLTDADKNIMLSMPVCLKFASFK